MGNERYLSVHIPKCGGTSLRDFYIDLFGDSNVYLYYETDGGLYRAKDRAIPLVTKYPSLFFVKRVLLMTQAGRELYLTLRRCLTKPNSRHLDLLPEEFSVIHGHFTGDHYGSIPGAKLVMVVREPLDRALSHYFYYRHLLRQRLTAVDPRFTLTTPFTEFAFWPDMINLQSTYLGSLSLQEFACVGTQYDLRRFCDYFDPQRQVPLQVVNKTERPRLDLSPEFISRFHDAHARDYELYAQAQAMV